jgi:hypothetical protein
MTWKNLKYVSNIIDTQIDYMKFKVLFPKSQPAVVSVISPKHRLLTTRSVALRLRQKIFEINDLNLLREY